METKVQIKKKKNQWFLYAKTEAASWGQEKLLSSTSLVLHSASIDARQQIKKFTVSVVGYISFAWCALH